MQNSETKVKLLLWSSMGIMTNIFYILIVFALITDSTYEGDPNSVYAVFLPFVLSSMFLSFLVILKGYRQEKDVKWGIIWTAIFHVPAIIGLVLAFIQMM